MVYSVKCLFGDKCLKTGHQKMSGSGKCLKKVIKNLEYREMIFYKKNLAKIWGQPIIISKRGTSSSFQNWPSCHVIGLALP